MAHALRLLVALALAALGSSCSEAEASFRNFRRNVGVGRASVYEPPGSLVYAFLVDAGEVAAITDACSSSSADITGTNAWCLRGDGGTVGEAMTITGGVTLENRRVCGNGPDCGGEYRQRFDATGEVVTGNVPSPAGDLTCCAVYTPDAIATTRLVSKMTGTSVANLGLSGTAGAINWTVYKAGGGNTSLTSSGVVLVRTRNMACGRYDYVADGTSISNIWHNGAIAAGSSSSTAAVGPLATASTPWEVHDAASAQTGTVSNAFCVPAYLPDATLVAMADSALGGKVTPAVGAVPTFTRTSAQYCPISGEAEISYMAPNRACISGGRFLDGLQSQSRVIQPEDFATTWTKISDGVTALPIVTANSTDVMDPYGTFTADKVVFPAVSGAGNYAVVNQTFAGTAFNAGSAVWARTAAGTCTLYQGFNISTPIYHSAAFTATTTWQRVYMNQKLLTSGTWNYTIGIDRRDSAQADQAGCTVYLIAAAVETTSGMVVGYLPGTTSVPLQTFNNLTTPNPLTGTPTKWCVSADVAPAGDGSSWSHHGLGVAGIMAQGTPNSANSTQLYIRRDGTPNVNRVHSYLYRSDATLQGAFTAIGSVTNGAHNIRAIYRPEPSQIFIDGVDTGFAWAGTPSAAAMTSFPATMGIGNDTGGNRHLHGWLSNFKVGNGPGACD